MTSANTNMTAYLLDSFSGALTTLTLKRETYIDQIKAHINCTFFDVVRIDDHHDVFVDDNGLTDGLYTVSHLKDFPNPLAGNLVIVGRTEEGDIANPRMSLEEVAALFRIYRPVMDPDLTGFQKPGMIGIGVAGFKVRLEESRPILAGGEVS
ncbi:hypothetical protein [uncultured Roseibium sp.]|uniref:DUF3846 domain-containing protein n=1 Tax=uncultured Roseibium sp. TaxID=1936171 RepID=UPI0026185F02|nr:hypothetical protein [uncultured Roseibium sp.]